MLITNKQINKQIKKQQELFEKGDEADIEFFPGPKAERLLPASTSPARKGASVWNASHQRGTFRPPALQPGWAPAVFYTTMSN